MTRGVHALDICRVVTALRVERAVLRDDTDALVRMLTTAAVIGRELLERSIAPREREDRRTRGRSHAGGEHEPGRDRSGADSHARTHQGCAGTFSHPLTHSTTVGKYAFAAGQ